VHNVSGGLFPLTLEQGNYHRQKAAPVLEHTAPQDVIMTADSAVFFRYLRYHAPARVEHLHNWPLQDMEGRLQALAGSGARVVALGDVFRPPAYLEWRDPRLWNALTRFARKAGPRFEPYWEDAFGGAYLLPASPGPRRPARKPALQAHR
jgi:hypothetical protein